MTATADSVQALIAEQFGTRVFTYVTPLRGKEGLDADSLDLVRLAVNLEERFLIQVTDDEADEAETVGDVIALVKRKIGGGEPSRSPSEHERRER